MTTQKVFALFLCSALLFLSGCKSEVAVSPPAEQKTVPSAQPIGAFVTMSQTNAEAHLVSGLYALEDNAWRWTAGKAVLKLHLEDASNLKFVMRYTIPAQLIRASKDVTVKILLNGTEWEKVRFEKDGMYEIDKPVPTNLLKPNADNLVTIELDKPGPPEANRAEIGLILVHAGFKPAS